MENNKFIVNPMLCTIATVTSAASLVLAVTMIYLDRFMAALCFVGFFLIFLGIAAFYGAVVSVGPEGVCKILFGAMRKNIPWENIVEIGVCGTSISGIKSIQRKGASYIYVSPEELDDAARFEMIVKWPPKGKIILAYNRVRMAAVQQWWSRELVSYNTGDLQVGED